MFEFEHGIRKLKPFVSALALALGARRWALGARAALGRAREQKMSLACQ